MSIRKGMFWLLLPALVAIGCEGASGPAPTAPPSDAAKTTPATTPAADKPAAVADDKPAAQEVAGVSQEKWGEADGKEVDLYTLKNRHGLIAKITNWGAIVTELDVPDLDGKLDDIVLGFKTLDGYVKGDGKQSNPAYFGAIIGRYCNRIGGAAFKLDGKTYTLAKNNGDNSLHGGKKGFDKCVWQAEPIKSLDGPSLKLTLTSPDGDEGYPGEVHAQVVYTLTDDNTLRVELQATCDKATPLNMTNHSYFNLAGEGKGTVLDHEVELKADRFTVFGPGDIPTGEIKPVEGTPLDFRKATAIGERIGQLKGTPGGYDHNYVLSDKKAVLDKGAPPEPKLFATVFEPVSGRKLDVSTTEPGVQFYSGNYLDGTLTGKRGAKYEKNGGFCLEPQFFPDTPNKLDFPSAILHPGETYRQVTVYRFGVRK